MVSSLFEEIDQLSIIVSESDVSNLDFCDLDVALKVSRCF
jgi:hypothetical protein